MAWGFDMPKAESVSRDTGAGPLFIFFVVVLYLVPGIKRGAFLFFFFILDGCSGEELFFFARCDTNAKNVEMDLLY